MTSCTDHHHHHSYGNSHRFIFRLMSLSWNNSRMSICSHHHICKSSNNIKNLCRRGLILWVNTAMFPTTYMKTTGWTSLGPILTRRALSTPARTLIITIQAYINKYPGLIILHRSEDQRELKGGKPADMMILFKLYPSLPTVSDTVKLPPLPVTRPKRDHKHYVRFSLQEYDLSAMSSCWGEQRAKI